MYKKLITLLLLVVLLASCSRKVYPDMGVDPTTTIPTPPPAPATTPTPPAWSFPLPGANVTSFYGPRWKKQHKGIDLQTFKGDSIRATFDGEVVFSGVGHGFGNLVRIKHDNGLETYYAHNTRNQAPPTSTTQRNQSQRNQQRKQQRKESVGIDGATVTKFDNYETIQETNFFIAVGSVAGGMLAPQLSDGADYDSDYDRLFRRSELALPAAWCEGNQSLRSTWWQTTYGSRPEDQEQR